MIYLIGSLRNPRIPIIGQELRQAGYGVFDDWYAGGERADDSWQAYEQGRGRSYAEALKGDMAPHIFEFDLKHLKRASTVVLVAPAGRSGHLELGWALGSGKNGYVLLDGHVPERWDIMYQFATGVYETMADLLQELEGRN